MFVNIKTLSRDRIVKKAISNANLTEHGDMLVVFVSNHTCKYAHLGN